MKGCPSGSRSVGYSGFVFRRWAVIELELVWYGHSCSFRSKLNNLIPFFKKEFNCYWTKLTVYKAIIVNQKLYSTNINIKMGCGGSINKDAKRQIAVSPTQVKCIFIVKIHHPETNEAL